MMCGNEEVIPATLRIKPPIKTREGYRITELVLWLRLKKGVGGRGAYLRDTMVCLSLDRVERVVASDMKFC